MSRDALSRLLILADSIGATAFILGIFSSILDFFGRLYAFGSAFLQFFVILTGLSIPALAGFELRLAYCQAVLYEHFLLPIHLDLPVAVGILDQEKLLLGDVDQLEHLLASILRHLTLDNARQRVQEVRREERHEEAQDGQQRRPQTADLREHVHYSVEMDLVNALGELKVNI